MGQEVIEVTYLPNGTIDPSITNQTYLDEVNGLLAPTISAARDLFNDPELDVWQLFNFMFVSIYWIFLADFGQIAPTTYPYTQSSIWEGYPSFTSPTQFPPTNNLFYNQTLFDDYGIYLYETILPFVEKKYNINVSLPATSGLDFKAIEPIPMTFVRGYTCSERELKEWVTVLVEVLVSDWAFLSGARLCLLWLARRLEARKVFLNDDGICDLTQFELMIEEDWVGLERVPELLRGEQEAKPPPRDDNGRTSETESLLGVTPSPER